MTLQEIPRVATITKEDFVAQYLKPQKPVVIERLTHGWDAYQKWHFDYINQLAGDKIVPLYDDRPVDYRDGFNQPHTRMKMSEYLSLLQQAPTNYRIFLYNLMKETPTLQNDFHWPDIGLRLVKQMPMLFFGGENSRVFMHFDIDYANILHVHFHGKKQCVIFPPEQTPYLYKVPHALISHEGIDFDRIDYGKWPALKDARGYIANLTHGEVLYMPEGYWHYMKYVTPGFSMSLRALPRSPKNLVKAAYNVFVMRHFDNSMRKWKGKSWIDWKNEQAIVRTHKKLNLTQ
jgi:hypothetical protein